MVFKCQEDGYLKEFESKVVLCEPAKLKRKNKDGKDEELAGFNVVLEDTVLFPEGGGQPCDYGTMNGYDVLDVQRKGAEAHHFVSNDSTPFKTGDSVNCTVDWHRRFDHMQQHSGQHLISAIFEQDFNMETIAWSLGADVSYIEFNISDEVTPEAIALAEIKCNDHIAKALPVQVQTLNAETTDLSSPEITRATRGLPKDHVGDIRVITIHGVDTNLCCGTHVTNLSQLRCVKLLNLEKTPKRQFLHFLVGDRVIKRLHESFERELQLNTILRGGPQNHIELAKKMQLTMKTNQRRLNSCLKEIAQLEANKLKAMTPLPKWYSVHRRDGIETDFNSVFLRNAPAIGDNDDNISLIFLTAGEEDSTKGTVQLLGNAEIVAQLAPQFCEILDGKGKANGQRFQAKVNNLKKVSECEKLIKAIVDGI